MANLDLVGHTYVKRVNPKGEVAIMQCEDCGKKMSMGEAMTTECPAKEKTPSGQALLDAIK